MKFNKKLAVAVSGAVLLMAGQFALADSTTDIVDALVSKGVLTEEEGKLITKGHAGEKKAQDKAVKGKLSISDALENATLYGDIRARYERRDGDVLNATPSRLNTDSLVSLDPKPEASSSIVSPKRRAIEVIFKAADQTKPAPEIFANLLILLPAVLEK